MFVAPTTRKCILTFAFDEGSTPSAPGTVIVLLVLSNIAVSGVKMTTTSKIERHDFREASRARRESTSKPDPPEKCLEDDDGDVSEVSRPLLAAGTSDPAECPSEHKRDPLMTRENEGTTPDDDDIADTELSVSRNVRYTNCEDVFTFVEVHRRNANGMICGGRRRTTAAPHTPGMTKPPHPERWTPEINNIQTPKQKFRGGIHSTFGERVGGPWRTEVLHVFTSSLELFTTCKQYLLVTCST